MNTKRAKMHDMDGRLRKEEVVLEESVKKMEANQKQIEKHKTNIKQCQGDYKSK